MKKFISLPMILVLLLLCGCEETQKNSNSSDTRFLLNTFVTLDAECDPVVLEQAFAVCANYEELLSKTTEGSDVHKINNSDGAVEVSDSALEIINRALYYSDLSGGKFDITVCPVSDLWDFNNEVVPSRDEIAEALKNVDYQQIRVDGNSVSSGNAKIDLGGIAKGYIADRLVSYFENSGVKNGLINLGGNIAVFGEVQSIGIKDPSGENKTIGAVKVKDCSVVTSGTYERFIQKDGKRYHHILDPDTGYGVETDLVSATVIGKSSMDCDALATVCILLGREKAKELIENTDGFEAVFINSQNKITYTSGILREGNEFLLK